MGKTWSMYIAGDILQFADNVACRHDVCLQQTTVVGLNVTVWTDHDFSLSDRWRSVVAPELSYMHCTSKHFTLRVISVSLEGIVTVKRSSVLNHGQHHQFESDCTKQYCKQNFSGLYFHL